MAKVKRAAALVLKRVPSAASFLSNATLVDPGAPYGPETEPRPVWTRAWTVLHRAADAASPRAEFLAKIAWSLGATQATTQCINALVGWVILRAAQSNDPEYASVSALAVARQAAVGGVVFHAAFVWTMVLIGTLSSLHDRAWEEEHERGHARMQERAGAGSHVQCGYCAHVARVEAKRKERLDNMPFVKLLLVFASGAIIAFVRAPVAGAIGFAIMKHAEMPLLDRDHAMRAHVVGTAVLLVPRAIVGLVARVVFLELCERSTQRKGIEAQGVDSV